MLTFLNAADMTCERCCNIPVTKTICGRSGSGARRRDHDADGLLLEALLVGGDDGVDLSLVSFPVAATTTPGPGRNRPRMLLKNLDPARIIPCWTKGGNADMRRDLYTGWRVKR